MLITMPTTTEGKPKRKITQLRIEPELLAAAAEIAAKRRMTLNAYICLSVENQTKADAALHATQ